MFLNFKKGVSVYVLTIFIDFHEITLLYVIFVLEKKTFLEYFLKSVVCCNIGGMQYTQKKILMHFK